MSIMIRHFHSYSNYAILLLNPIIHEKEPLLYTKL